MNDEAEPLPLSIQDFESAQARIDMLVHRTPLVPLAEGRAVGSTLLKLESEQKERSYKVRGALNATLAIPANERSRGVVTVSSGNMGRAVAWSARLLGIGATVGIPPTAPDIKVQALRSLGAKVVTLTAQQWWDSILRSDLSGYSGTFIHPVMNREVIAGAGTVTWEILEEVDDLSTVFVPFGGGALALGAASAIQLQGRDVQVVACEPSAKAPLSASFRHGHEVSVDPKPSIVDAAGGPGLLPSLWPWLRQFVSRCVEVDDVTTRETIRLLQRAELTTSEPAGALSLAAALARKDGETAACVISGGNIDRSLLDNIMGVDFQGSEELG